MSLWLRKWGQEAIPKQWEMFLSTFPFANGREGFTELTVRAVGPAEATLSEYDLREAPATAAEIIELGAEWAKVESSDTEFQVKGFWDVWVYDAAVGRCKLQAEPVLMYCRGEEYDDGAFAERGHIEIEAGFEHLFTGHAHLLGRGESRTGVVSDHALEVEFLARMKVAELRRDYEEKTRENIRKVFDWMKTVEETVRVARYLLWSEGEENFEARVDEILALH